MEERQPRSTETNRPTLLKSILKHNLTAKSGGEPFVESMKKTLLQPTNPLLFHKLRAFVKYLILFEWKILELTKGVIGKDYRRLLNVVLNTDCI